MFSDLKFMDAGHTVIQCVQSGSGRLKTLDDGSDFFARAVGGEWGAVSPYVAPSATEADVRAEAGRRLAAVVAAYSKEERETWPRQYAEAKAWKAWSDESELTRGESPETPLIDGILGGAVSAIVKAAFVAALIAEQEAIMSQQGAIINSLLSVLGQEPIPADYADDSRWPA